MSFPLQSNAEIEVRDVPEVSLWIPAKLEKNKSTEKKSRLLTILVKYCKMEMMGNLGSLYI